MVMVVHRLLAVDVQKRRSTRQLHSRSLAPHLRDPPGMRSIMPLSAKHLARDPLLQVSANPLPHHTVPWLAMNPVRGYKGSPGSDLLPRQASVAASITPHLGTKGRPLSRSVPLLCTTSGISPKHIAGSSNSEKVSTSQ